MATKDLDFGNVIKQVYDPPTESLKVLATISVGTVTVDLDAADDSIRLGDGTLLNTLTAVGGKNAVDVYLAGGSLAIDIDHTDDSVRLGDGTNYLTSTTTGPKIALDVSIVDGTVSIDGGTVTTEPYVIENIFQENLAIASGATQTILTYTAPSDKLVFFIGVSGSNIGTFTIYNGMTILDRIRTTYTKFDGSSNLGDGVLKILSGTQIRVEVTNNASTPGDFEAKIQVRDP